jgi:tetratricopeptide (TPR) repeat protein
MFRRSLAVSFFLSLGVSGCSLNPFKAETSAPTSRGGGDARAGSGPVLSSPPVIAAPGSGSEPVIEAPAQTPLPRERPRKPPATLGPASSALVAQAQAQRRKGDLPGATVTLERALRIEPGNPLLWIEMGQLRMDQHNFAQAEGMGRKALAMSVGDDQTQSQAWRLIADSQRARGKDAEAQNSIEHARELSPN